MGRRKKITKVHVIRQKRIRDALLVTFILLIVSGFFLFSPVNFVGLVVQPFTNTSITNISNSSDAPVLSANDTFSAPAVETPTTSELIESFIDTSTDAIIVGKPVKWKRTLNLSEQSNNLNIELPPESENISIKKVVNEQEVTVEDFSISDPSKLAN